MKDCCKIQEEQKNRSGLLSGLLFGILPHSFCIAFVVLSVLGATVASTIFRKFLLLPYFFESLIGLSFIFAAISAVLYLKRKERLSVRGIRENLGYLGILLGMTIAVNLLLFFVIFPATANMGTIGKRGEIRVIGDSQGLKTAVLEVQIPCAGHAGLITGELRGLRGVSDVRFIQPNLFEVRYDSQETNSEKILALPIFKTFTAAVK